MKDLILKNVTKEYQLGKTKVRGVRDISLSVDKGEFVCIAGSSGSGKSTLLNLVGCIDKPTRGDIKVVSFQVNNLKENKLAEIRLRNIGFIFQSFNLVDTLDVYENVQLPLILLKNHSKNKQREKVDYFLNEVGIYDKKKHRPMELSGGQRQRVAIARALVTNPDMVLADEPTANLDSEIGQSIVELMKKINSVEKTTFIFSSHDPEVIKIASRLIKLKDGEVILDSNDENVGHIEVIE